MARIELSREESELIQERIQRFAVEAPERMRSQVAYVRDHQALPLFLDLFAALGIRADGVLVRWSIDGEPGVDSWPGVREVDERSVNFARVRCAVLYPQLRSLLPKRPATAITCEKCKGRGTPEGLRDGFICICSGLGWVPNVPLGLTADHRKALPPHFEFLVGSRSAPPLQGSAPPGSAPLQPLDYDGTVTLPEATLRSMACESPVPGARLAASWRLLVRGQALPPGAPGEGLRCLLLLNLATQQDLEILEVLLCLDPSPKVRGQAAILLWRVARDRDRVVDRLASQLEKEEVADVLVQLLSLVPALPFEKTRSIARSLLRYPSLDFGRAKVRAWCLQRWANDPSHADMIRDVGKYPEPTGAVLEALALAGRSFRLTEMSTLLDHRHLDAVLRIARRPFDVTDRRILVSLTGFLAPGRDAGPDGADGRSWRRPPRVGRIGKALWGCLREAYLAHDAPELTEEEKTWASVLREQIAAREATGTAPVSAAADEEMGSAYDMRRLLSLLTISPDASSGVGRVARG
jgi:hypothetical protein